MLSEAPEVDRQQLLDQLAEARNALHRAENLIGEVLALRPRSPELVDARTQVRQARAGCWAHSRELAGGPPVEYPVRFAPQETIGYVLMKLGLAEDSFLGRVLLQVDHADVVNRERLRRSWPWLVQAWERWQASPDGEFEVPPRG